MRAFAWALAACFCSLSAAGADDNWNQFRGPRGDGTSTVKGLPVEFSEGSKEIVWKTPLPGRAWSSPVVWGNQIWVTNAPELHNLAEGETKLDKPLELSAVCFDVETGKILHDIVLFKVDKPQFTHLTNSYGSPTPYIEEGRVYIHFGAYGTACLDPKTGRPLWERTDLECDHFRGPGSSPVVYGNLLYLTFDGFDQQYIIALNKATGETVWRRDRDVDFGTTDGDAKKAYSTPLLIHVGGRELLISPFASHTIAYNPQTGEPIWTVKHGGMNAAGRPLYGHGLVYINTADGPNPLVAVAADGTGDITDKIAWRSTKSVPKRPSSLLLGDLLFMMNDGGVASCLEAKTGKELWTKRLPGEYWASPLYADGLIYCCSQKGEIPVFKAAREFELVAENKLDDGFLASPAVAGKALILRSKTHLYRIEKP
ncbi:PQQ-binding-like beta-propeller repeat protein [Planctellipticum variicoloris]|uniref:PQQ-binding-like beta-propeller repeat protein n=1 Tax=Planctellipticum variicoloris TaxID=3064265 RepID=UPI00301339E1|nr:PQQ-binding-like beta-propeller repeat protein [Planctomycetaceae bacterium SH412]